MRFNTPSLLSLSLALCAEVQALPRANGQPYGRSGLDECSSSTRSEGKAVYFMTNSKRNEIVALEIGANGTLSEGTRTGTLGSGGQLVNANTKAPDMPDSLASQGSVTIAGNVLFAVNPGSNTVSAFSISPWDPTKLRLLGKPMNTNGDFPTSVTASLDLLQVCVANTGAVAGISCAHFSENYGISKFDTLRPFQFNQSSPPTGPLNGIGDILFSDDMESLIVTVKGDPTKNNTGFVATYPVTDDGSISQTVAKTSPSGTAVLFGSVPVPYSSRIFATDASFGAAILDLNNLTNPVAVSKIPGQQATCWATISPRTNTGFVTDVAFNRLVEIDTDSGSIISTFNATNTNLGMTDISAVGNKLYALSPNNVTDKGASVTVFDVSGGKGSVKQLQTFMVSGAGGSSQGLAIF